MELQLRWGEENMHREQTGDVSIHQRAAPSWCQTLTIRSQSVQFACASAKRPCRKQWGEINVTVQSYRHRTIKSNKHILQVLYRDEKKRESFSCQWFACTKHK